MADDVRNTTNSAGENSPRMRSPADLARALRSLCDHLRRLDSGSGDAALMDEAASYIEGAAESLKDHIGLARSAREALRRLFHDGLWNEDHPDVVYARAVLGSEVHGENSPADAWQPIYTAPVHGPVLVYAAPAHDLPAFQCVAQWHPDGGWCVDELREATHWRLLPEPPR